MNLSFYKYEATGNDFILFDNRNNLLNETMQAFFSAICDRRFGIGADGVMLLQNHPEFDFEMVYLNADGKPGSLCGNGSRCMIRFATKMGIVKKSYCFLASDGAHKAVVDEKFISLQMKDISELKIHDDAFEMNTGSPHYIRFINNVSEIDVKKEGRRIRNSEAYSQKGINVNFAEEKDNSIYLRTYERGVEDETFSCGTGVTAAALTYSVLKNFPNGNYTIEVNVLGGKLIVEFEKYHQHEFKNIWLKGPANFVFEGTIALPQ